MSLPTLTFHPFSPDSLPPKDEIILVLCRSIASTRITGISRQGQNLRECRVFPAIAGFAQDPWGRDYLVSLHFVSPATMWAAELPTLPPEYEGKPASHPVFEGEWGPLHPDTYRARYQGSIQGENIPRCCEGWATITGPAVLPQT